MTEEITYADLKFQEPYPLENITEPEYTEKEACPNLSSKWRVAALTSITLCLLLLVGLAALAVLFFQATKDKEREAEELKQMKEVLQTNFSKLQEIRNSLCLEGEKEKKNNGVSCPLCPAHWQWRGGNSCYYVSTNEATWSESQKSCSMWNSTLVLVKDESKKEFLKNQFPIPNYWIGLSFKEERNGWFWEDNITFIHPHSQNSYRYYPCAYLGSWHINYNKCETKYNWICEKAVFQLNLTDSHHKED
ncbi:C-type lectin domain family 12 member B isoform X1 [Alligator sinensis]|uniref:C-type lectin domain family 12 member B isoform X1 n=1 Tax=Alligator sinensis TaxID=38654 RepID=A0A3Q0FQE0_ALLSI|nr:C-type lectin domain family 12 member B isoform X1 [Alligator sinensis]XP_025049866.1 C-type lectin domain family 12 member B isoform X1 [Alligator sinensis]